jgi:diaminopimelate epimerase
MKLKFTKMHGAGNDFVVIDAINQDINLGPDQWPDPDRRAPGHGRQRFPLPHL